MKAPAKLRENIVASVRYGDRHEMLTLKTETALDHDGLYEAVRKLLGIPQWQKILISRYSKSENRYAPLDCESQVAAFGRSIKVKGRFKFVVNGMSQSVSSVCVLCERPQWATLDTGTNSSDVDGEQLTQTNVKRHVDVDDKGEKELAKREAKELKLALKESEKMELEELGKALKSANQSAKETRKKIKEQTKEQTKEQAKRIKAEVKRAKQEAKQRGFERTSGEGGGEICSASFAGAGLLAGLLRALTNLPEFEAYVRGIVDRQLDAQRQASSVQPPPYVQAQPPRHEQACDECGAQHEGTVFTCVDCRYALCKWCVDDPNITDEHKNHRLVCSGRKFKGEAADPRPLACGAVCTRCSSAIECGGFSCLHCNEETLCDMCYCTADLGPHVFESFAFSDEDSRRCTACKVVTSGPLYVCTTCENSRDMFCDRCVRIREDLSAISSPLARHCAHVFVANVQTKQVPNGQKIVQQLQLRAWCDGCDKLLKGERYKCLTCEDFDFCRACFMSDKYFKHGHVGFCLAQTPANNANSTAYVVCDVCNSRIPDCCMRCTVCPDFDVCLNCHRSNPSVHEHPLVQVLANEYAVHNNPGRQAAVQVAKIPCLYAKCSDCNADVNGEEHWCLECDKVVECSQCFEDHHASHQDHQFATVKFRTSGACCDMCDKVIRNTRFKCLRCPDYDLCLSCYMLEGKRHRQDHSFLVFQTPVSTMFVRCHCSACKRGGGDMLASPWLWFKCVECHNSHFCLKSVRSGKTGHDPSHLVKAIIDQNAISEETFKLADLASGARSLPTENVSTKSGADDMLISLDSECARTGTIVKSNDSANGNTTWTVRNDTTDCWPEDTVLVVPSAGVVLSPTLCETTGPESTVNFVGKVSIWDGAMLVSRSAKSIWSVELALESRTTGRSEQVADSSGAVDQGSQDGSVEEHQTTTTAASDHDDFIPIVRSRSRDDGEPSNSLELEHQQSGESKLNLVSMSGTSSSHQTQIATKLERIVPVPADRYPEIDFKSLLVGHRGHALAKMQLESGARIIVHSKKNSQGLDENLRCSIIADGESKIEKAVELVQKIVDTAISVKGSQETGQQLQVLASPAGSVKDEKPASAPTSTTKAAISLKGSQETGQQLQGLSSPAGSVKDEKPASAPTSTTKAAIWVDTFSDAEDGDDDGYIPVIAASGQHTGPSDDLHNAQDKVADATKSQPMSSSTESLGGYATATLESNDSAKSTSSAGHSSEIILPTLPRESPQTSIEDILRFEGGVNHPHSTTEGDHGVLSDSDFSENEYDIVDSAEVFSDYSEMTS